MLYLLLALFTAAIVAVDQLTKYLAASNLVGKTVTLIPGWLQLHYITNDGMALSLLRGARWLFVVMTVVYLAIVSCLERTTHNRKVKSSSLFLATKADGMSV